MTVSKRSIALLVVGAAIGSGATKHDGDTRTPPQPIVVTAPAAKPVQPVPTIQVPQTPAPATTERVMPNGTVAPEVCERNGAVERVIRTGDVYRVTCHSGIIMMVAAR